MTSIGKEFANRHDSDSKRYNKKQAKISVWVAIRRNKTEYLIGTRLKNPFLGAQGFLTGKLDYGESIYNGAKREMKEETNFQNEISSPFDSYEDFIKDIELIENFDGTVTFEEREVFPSNF